MKCLKCGSSWDVADNIKVKIRKCPFCGSECYEGSIEGQMRKLVCQHGAEIFNNAVKINGILADMFPKNDKERATIKTALNVGAGRMFYEIAKNSTLDHAAQVALIRKKLIEEGWISETASDYVCRVFLTAIGKEELLNTNVKSPNLQPKQRTEIQPQPTQRPEIRLKLNHAPASTSTIPVMMADKNYTYTTVNGDIGSIASGDGRVFGSEWKCTQITAITFLNSLGNKPDSAWDVSAEQDKSVMAWVIGEKKGDYHLYIGAEGGIMAPTTCEGLFGGYCNLEQINFNGWFDTSQVINMELMFCKCESLENLDVSGFDTSQVVDMKYMFRGCKSLKNLNVSGFDTSQVTNMKYMFYNCGSLENLDVSGFDTSQVTNMRHMFDGCNSLENLDVSGFDTSQVTDMAGMFALCKSLENLDVSGFDTSQVTDMAGMFYKCESLENLDVSGFDMTKVTDKVNMTVDCKSVILNSPKP